MKRNSLLLLLGSIFWICFSGNTLGLEPAAPTSSQERAQGLEDVGRDIRGWFGRWWEYFGGTTTPEQRPVISMMLKYRDRLGLSAEQIKNLEQLKTDFEKQSIRRDADLRVAELDLNTLLEAKTVEVSKVEAKIREIERLRADGRIARIRTIEKGKAELTAEQRKKFQEILTESPFQRSQPGTER